MIYLPQLAALIALDDPVKAAVTVEAIPPALSVVHSITSTMQQQAYPVENKGTLLPGQTISVNKYTVQVERYLSQGTPVSPCYSHV